MARLPPEASDSAGSESGLAESGVEQARETFAARQVLSAMVAPVTRGETLLWNTS